MCHCRSCVCILCSLFWRQDTGAASALLADGLERINMRLYSIIFIDLSLFCGITGSSPLFRNAITE